MRRCSAVAIGGVLLLVAGFAAHALPDGMQALLRTLPSAAQHTVRTHAATLAAMTPTQRQALEARLEAWRALDEPRRRELRARWQAWAALPDTERDALRTAANAYAALPVEQRLALRARFDALDGSERRGWLLGSTLGVDYPRLQPLLAQVPEGQRQPLLDTLRAMDAAERIDLAVLAQRTPPSQRDALRRELLSTAAGNRRAWLRGRLDR